MSLGKEFTGESACFQYGQYILIFLFYIKVIQHRHAWYHCKAPDLEITDTYLQFHIIRDYNHCRLSDKIGLRWKIGFPNNYHFLVSCFQDKIHLLEDIFNQFLWNRHYCRIVVISFCKNFRQYLNICGNYGCLWWNALNSFMLCSWLGETLVSSSREWRTPFNLPGKAVMLW